MKLLLIPYLNKKRNDFLTTSIKQILNDKGHIVEEEEEEVNPATIYDYIITFDKKNISRIKKIYGNKSKIIYITCMSEVAHEYIFNEASIHKRIIFLDKKCTLNLVGVNANIVMNMLAPNFSLDKIINQEEVDKPGIYIDIDNDMLNSDVFLKILPLINALADYQIYLYTKNRAIASLINKHIKIVKNMEEIESYINRADIVIGSGYSAFLACKLRKKVIVVGERGYGGLVTETNIQAFYSNFFQGRNGGKLDEYIPLQLLAHDIETDIDEQNKQLLLGTLQQSEQGNIDHFMSIFENHLLEEDNIDKQYIINPCYTVGKVNKFFYVIDTNTNKRIKRINESECVIMVEFRNSNNISTLLNKYPAEYKDDIYLFVQELIEKKYLVPRIEMGLVYQGHPLVIE